MFEFLSFLDPFHVSDYVAMVFFVFAWFAYAKYTRKKVKKRDNLNQAMFKVRKQWVYQSMMAERHHRVQDAQVMNILHRGISFFVSTTILVIAGLFAVLSSGDSAIWLINSLPLAADNVLATWQFKVLLNILVFVICFFRLTWSLRQNQYINIALMSTPCLKHEKHADVDPVVKDLSLMLTSSGDNFNYAIRGYYFGLSMFVWLFNPYLFILSNVVVMLVLYRREFYSSTLRLLKEFSLHHRKLDQSYKR